MTAGDPPVRSRIGDETRQKILETARQLFGTTGFDATSVREIAEAVGLTDAALYYHFKSKREILSAIWELPVEGGVRRLRSEGPFVPSQLDAITDSAVAFSVANDHILRLMCREILGGDQTALALRQQNRAVLRRTLYESFLTVFDADEADIRTEAILALLTGVNMKTQMAAGPDFPRIAAQPAYRERIRSWARALAGLEEQQAG